MSDPIERHSHISITRQTPVGIVHADMHITSVEISGMPGDMGDDLVGDCFDPDSCCDEHEKAMIAALRAGTVRATRVACTRRCGRVLRRDFGLGPCLEARQAG